MTIHISNLYSKRNRIGEITFMFKSDKENTMTLVHQILGFFSKRSLEATLIV